MLDPTRLDATLEDYCEAPAEQFGGLSRMVNRNDATVTAVYVGGRRVVADGRPTALLGRERTGRFLRAEQSMPALSRSEVADQMSGTA